MVMDLGESVVKTFWLGLLYSILISDHFDIFILSYMHLGMCKSHGPYITKTGLMCFQGKILTFY